MLDNKLCVCVHVSARLSMHFWLCMCGHVFMLTQAYLTAFVCVCACVCIKLTHVVVDCIGHVDLSCQ